MGNLVVPAPKTGKELTNLEVRAIIKEKLRITDNTRINLFDGRYYAISLEDLKLFLTFDFSDMVKYKKEIFDCDDFAYLLLGRQRLWHAKLNLNLASTFGMVIGDIRTSEESQKPRGHAMNFIITPDKELYLVEPQTDNIYKPTSNSTFSLALC